MQITNYIKAFRPKQWLKNGIILFPAFFGLTILNEGVFLDLIIISLGFCLVASSIYFFNDLSDIKADLLHPLKRDKPITSGKIGKKEAFVVACCLFILGTTLVTLIYSLGIYFCLAYLIVNVIYSLGAKHLPILDVLLVSVGFLIRIYLGGNAINVPISWWLSSLIFLMAIFILIAKRKDDVIYFKGNNQGLRGHIYFYSKLNFSIVLNVISVLIIVVYTFYTFSEGTVLLFETEFIWITIPFAALGLFRFTQQILKTKNHIEPIALILKSKVIVCSLLAWIIIFGWLIYG